MDLILMNKINEGGWVAINFLPTAAHTIWGALVGKLFLSSISPGEKLKRMLVWGIIALCVGYVMNFTITPIIKRIATSSFVLASGGWCLVALCFLYWWIDLRGHKKYVHFFVIVGMNSLFIYLFIEIVGGRWFNDYIAAISNGLMGFAHVPESLMLIITSLVTFALEWIMLRFLYNKGIFFKV